jgi:hypothetical protein
MNNQFGPWATAMHGSLNAQLNTFWQRRLTRLPMVAQSKPTLTPPAVIMIFVAALAIGLMLTLYGSDAAAEDGKSLAAAQPDSRQPVVSGRVTDAQGGPVEGVSVQFYYGMGTLYPIASTETDKDGRYTLPRYSGPGMGASVIMARKSGFAEKSRKGDDFVLVPAPTVDVELLDAEGKPIARKEVFLSDNQLPPACNVLAEGNTDSQGHVTFKDVPPTFACWFLVEAAPRHDARTPHMIFSHSEKYRVRMCLARNAGSGADLIEVLSVKNAEGKEVREQVTDTANNSHGS